MSPEREACFRCGRAKADDPHAALTWALDTSDPAGRQQWLCPACGRENVRAIEGKLAPEYW